MAIPLTLSGWASFGAAHGYWSEGGGAVINPLPENKGILK